MLMKITPDGAQKLIRSLEEDRHQLVEKINKLSTFVVAVSEGNPEDLRPEFDCMGTIKEIDMIDQRYEQLNMLEMCLIRLHIFQRKRLRWMKLLS